MKQQTWRRRSIPAVISVKHQQLSNEKMAPGCLGYRGEYTTGYVSFRQGIWLCHLDNANHSTWSRYPRLELPGQKERKRQSLPAFVLSNMDWHLIFLSCGAKMFFFLAGFRRWLKSEANSLCRHKCVALLVSLEIWTWWLDRPRTRSCKKWKWEHLKSQ